MRAHYRALLLVFCATSCSANSDADAPQSNASSRYAFTEVSTGPVASNAAQFLQIRPSNGGVEITPVLASEGWKLDISTESFGRSGHPLETTTIETDVRDEQVTRRRPDFSEQIINRADGVEQSWTVKNRPGGKGPLEVVVRFNGLTPRAFNDTIALFHDDVLRFTYDDLVVTDATGRTIPASYRVHTSWAVAIEVDDTDAQYPLLIDPTLARIAQYGATNPTAGDRFGTAVAVVGDLAAIGAPGSNSGAGAVFVFRRGTNGIWAQSATMTATDSDAQDALGTSVAIHQGTVFAGAPGDDAAGVNAGAVYLFNANNGVQAAKLTTVATGANGELGAALAVTSNAVANPNETIDVVLAGAPGTNRVFAWHNSSAVTWGTVNSLEGPAGSRFGSAVAFSADGTSFFVGAPATSTGEVHRGAIGVDEFDVDTAHITLEQVLSAPVLAAGDQFGSALSSYGPTLAVGAPEHQSSGAVFRFGANTGGANRWGLLNRVLDGGAPPQAKFGSSVANLGGLLVVGEPGSGAGAAAFLGQNQGGAGAWGVIGRVESPTGNNGDEFGVAASMSSHLVIGAPGESATGQFHVYALAGEITAVDDSYVAVGSAPLVVAAPGVLSNDIDPNGSPLTAVLKSMPSGASLTVNPNGGFSFTANGTPGTRTFTYAASDGTSESAPATVTIEVASPNAAPVANDDAASTPRDTPVTVSVLANDNDPDGDTLTLQGVTQPASGTTTLDGDRVRYTPNPGFSGLDSFTYTVAATGGTDTATVRITVTSNNGAPVAVQDTVSTTEETQVTIFPLANDSDPEGDTLTLDSIGAPAHGTATQSGNSVIYTPEANYAGFDTFSYFVRDTEGNITQGTIRVAISDVRDPPVASNDTAATTKSTPVLIDVLANDSDPDSVPTISSVQLPSNGTARIVGQQIEYTPTGFFVGTDSFQYTITDGTAFSTATVTVTIADANLLPQFGPPTPVSVIRRAAGSTIAFTVFAADPDGGTVTYSISNPPTGATLDASSGAFSWLTNASHSGTTRLTFTASDGTDQVSRVVTVELSFADGDGDGVSDDWEDANGLDSSTIDTDMDGISDGHEVGLDLTNVPDTDMDGKIDALDDDSDGDGLLDSLEAGDDDLDTPPRDTDGDGTPDFRDTESDGDGIEDNADNCPFLPNPDQADLDTDQTGDLCDDDRDGDGVANDIEVGLGLNPDDADTDADTISDSEELISARQPSNVDGDDLIDALDPDSDGDSIADIDEAGDADLTTPAVDTDGDNIPDFRDDDSDNDTVLDSVDNCRTVPNAAQADENEDGVGDACDTADRDGDGVPDVDDNCPSVENSDQRDTDGDMSGDACDDNDDDDQLADVDDNCPLVANDDQRDEDGDGQGDACDTDDDDDGVPDVTDNCPLDANPDQADENDNGTGDVCETFVVPDDAEPDEGCCRVIAPTRSPAPAALAIGFALLGILRVRRN